MSVRTFECKNAQGDTAHLVPFIGQLFPTLRVLKLTLDDAVKCLKPDGTVPENSNQFGRWRLKSITSLIEFKLALLPMEFERDLVRSVSQTFGDTQFGSLKCYVEMLQRHQDNEAAVRFRMYDFGLQDQGWMDHYEHY